MARVTIFHTSDMHNKLTPARMAELQRLKAGAPAALMFDSGDAIWAGNAFWRPGGEPVLDLMNAVSYDAMCIGNREFHFLNAGLVSKTSRAAFPALSANLRGARTPDGVMGSVFFERDGVRIGVFGLSVPCVTERMLMKRVSSHYFEQPVKAAAELAPKLRKDCDLLIALTHIGIKQDRDLSVQVSGIDLVLGGHTHTVTDPPERVGETWILHHGHHCKHVGKVDVDITDGRIALYNELIPLPEA